MDPSPPIPVSPAGKDDKLWIILCHLSLLLGVGFLLPLVIYLVNKQESNLVARHAKEALNFHISVYIYGLISVPLCFVLIGFPLLFAVAIGSIVCSILAAIKASEGQFYKYPLTIRLVA